MGRRLLVILFWSVIAAAFIGPGTLVTASSAGAGYGLSLVWTLVFATLACILFQEMAARLTIITKKDLASTLKNIRPFALVAIVPFGVVLGCVAYEAGNLIGGAIGLQEVLGFTSRMSLLITGAIAIALISFTRVELLVKILGGLVALMGFVFIYLSFQADWTLGNMLAATVQPSVPSGAEWVVLALIGTTVVPYNLFLGSGLGEYANLKDMRFGLVVSVILGGIISLAILLTGTLMEDEASLSGLIEVVGNKLGNTGQIMVALGVFAAGITSAITAPLAAGFIVSHFFTDGKPGVMKITAMTVVLAGMLMGLLDIKPEAMIIAAQAANGLALPLVAAFLWVVTNRTAYMGNQVSSGLLNVATFLMMNVLIIIGVRSLIRVWGTISGAVWDPSLIHLGMISVPITLILAFIIRQVRAA